MMNPAFQPVNPYAAQMKEDAQRYMKGLDQKLKEQVIAVFCNPHGLQLLDTLYEMFVHQPVSPPGSVKGYGFMREGENRLIIKLRAIVNNAQKDTA
jgi:hypothetical protein